MEDKNLKEKLKSLIVKKSENNKKNIENLVFFLILLIITIFSVKMIWGNKDENTNEENKSDYASLAQAFEPDSNTNINEKSEYNLEEEIQNILSKIKGVGRVEVLITYSETSQVVALYNESQTVSNTEETDSDGGIRTIQTTDITKDVIFEEENGENKIITEKVILPKIEGAVVIAEGAENAVVKTNIIQAVSAATGLSTYKVQVFEMEG